MKAAKSITPKGMAMVESATISPGIVSRMSELHVDRVEAERHDHRRDHLGDDEQEVEEPATRHEQRREGVGRRRGDEQGQQHGAEADEQARGEVRKLVVEDDARSGRG